MGKEREQVEPVLQGQPWFHGWGQSFRLSEPQFPQTG